MSFSQPKVIIIGAGIVGLTTALELIEHGYRVEIFDQSAPAQAASWAGGGILSPMYPWKYHPAINQLAKSGKERYLAWNQKLLSVTGIDFEIQPQGMMIFDQDQFDVGLSYSADFADVQQTAKHLQGDELHRLHPHLNTEIDQALYFEQIASVRNPRLVKSLLHFLQQHPHVTLHKHCAIQKFEKNAHQIDAVIDEFQQRHSADHYVIATGAWTDQLVQEFDLTLEIQPIHGQMVLYKTPENWLPSMYMNNTMYLIPRRDGHIVCGSSTHQFGFDTQVHDTIAESIIDSATHLVPALKQFPIVHQWAGLRPGSPDGIPKIGKLPEFDNLWLNAGHYRNGLVMSPASAQLLREQMQGIATFIDARPYQV